MADDRESDTERTTIVTTDRDGRGSARIVLAVLAILILLAVLFFGGVFDREDERDLNVAIETPDVNLIVPETQVPVVEVPPVEVPPDVNVNVITPPPEPLPPETNDSDQSNAL